MKRILGERAGQIRVKIASNSHMKKETKAFKERRKSCEDQEKMKKDSR